MKVLLVTSEVTFVPGNYKALVQGMCNCPQIGGLMIIKNSSPSMLFKALGLMIGGAPRFGKELLRNYFIGSKEHEKVYSAAGKPVWIINGINTENARQIIFENQFDLVVNARTRYIYKSQILELPPLGCINIHHGLLPNQRGLMCDLWALSESSPAGFTIHKMNQKIDDGLILKKAIVSDGTERNFMRYVKAASELECETLKKLLAEIELHGFPEGKPNLMNEIIPMRKTPTFSDIRAFKKKGLKL